MALVRLIGELGSDKEWETTVVQALMTSKQYLKGDSVFEGVNSDSRKTA